MPRTPAPVGYPHPDIHHQNSDIQQHPPAGNNNIPYPQQPQPQFQQQPHAQFPYPYQQFPTYTAQHQPAFDPQQQQQHPHHQPQHPQASVVYQPAAPQAHPYASHPSHFYTSPPVDTFQQHLDSPQPPFATHQAYLSPQQQQSALLSSPGLASSPGTNSSTAWPHQQQQQQYYLLQQQQFAQPTASVDWQHSPQPPQSTSGVSNPSPQPPVAPAPAAAEQAEIVSKLPRITLRVPRRGTDADGDDDNMVGRRRTSGTASLGGSEESHGLRSSTRNSGRRGRAVNYAEDDDEDFEEQPPSEPDTRPPARATRRTTRRIPVMEEDDDADAAFDEDAEGEVDEPSPVVGTRRSSRAHKPPNRYHGEDDFEESMMLDSSPAVKRAPPAAPPAPAPAASSGRRSSRRRLAVDPDEEDEAYAEPQPNGADVLPPPATETAAGLNALSQRSRSKRRGSDEDADSFNPSESDAASSSETEADAPEDNFEVGDGDSFVSDDSPPRRRPMRKSRPAPAPAPARRSTRTSRRTDPDSDGEYGARRNLRKRDSRPNYQLPPLDISAELAASDALDKAIAAASGPGPRGPGRRGPSGFGTGARFGPMGNGIKPLPWSMKGRDFAQAMGDPDSSDSDNDLAMPNAAAAAAGPAALGGAAAARGAAGIPGPTDVPNFGRVNPKSNMADADPLGVDTNVTFDRVGGLDGHINQLKEMVALPLLYPELFQQFSITPPRGVLFHGPPGTGKTLLARALAASCSNGNQKIAFFMRKGADVLSKWVGEAERQLRMLFEEARASQPSIIFFDEIDGLAPVRSSKQDQIHASLVSTLLALMDGMDGRGQVIVIGATNRPDAVDPALRRPGRFDREFYFPLPNRDARRQIIGINTRDWEPALPSDMLDTLATLTKGYGGADLRALCTEAALNAIQRKYPQIYKTTDRLLVKPGSVRVQPKDFMLAVKKIVPSSARSSSSAAVQLPKQLVPLLSHDLDRLKAAVDLALPQVKKRTALEEAEFVDEDGDSFDKEMMLQSLDKLRTYRPRLLVYGPTGSGQMYLGPAILHHLEGFHVQSFDLATLMGDSTRTPEAAIVQMFVEAKRHQPSIMFIPSLAQWAETLSETARSTTRALLDGISPSDPVLLLAIVDGPLDTLPPDVRAWFGFGEENRIELGRPSSEQRGEFFEDLLEAVRRIPTDFPDGVPRKKRVLEELPLAPPLPPRQPTAVEVQRELERDAAARNMLLVSFTSLIQEFWRKYRRPVEIVRDEAAAYSNYLAEQAAMGAPPVPEVQPASLVPANGLVGVPGVVESQVTDAPQAMAMAQLDPTVSLQDDVTVPPVPEVLPVPAVPEVPSASISAITEVPATQGGATETSGDSLDAAARVATNATNATDTSAPTMATYGTETTHATAGTAVPDTSGPTAPTWQVHNMDLAIIKHKLVKHKYHTPQDVLDDFALIEENAKHTMDADRQLKVSEMVAHARMHVQGFDPKWTPEFERYAVRMRERKADRAKAKALSRAATRSGSKASDSAAVAAAPATEGGAEEGASTSGKRPRDGEGDDDGSDRAKRPRENGMDVDDAAVPIAPDTGAGEGAATSATAPQSPTNASQPEGAAGEGERKFNGGEGAEEPAATASAAATRTPTPPPVYPDFICPEAGMEELRRALKLSTGDLNVDELEQLRASLLDRVWRARAEWDRTKLVADMQVAVDRFVREVRLVRDAEWM